MLLLDPPLGHIYNTNTESENLDIMNKAMSKNSAHIVHISDKRKKPLKIKGLN